MTRGGAGSAILDLAGELGVVVSAEQQRALREFCTLLLTWNARINLTGAKTTAELEDEHLPDAVAMAAVVGSGARLVDVGSGGGLPAVPFAILKPDVRLTLVEPRAKRAAFLRTALRAVGSQGAVLVCRAEELGASDHFEVASSRATFAPADWLAVGRGLAEATVVFAAQNPGLIAEGAVLERELVYRTGRGHPRWLGVFRST